MSNPIPDITVPDMPVGTSPPPVPPEKPKRGRRPATGNPGDIAKQIKTGVKGGAVVAQPPAPAPVWTASGVGQIPVGLHNFMFAVYHMADLEPEEEKGLAEDTAYYLNMRWPTGAKYEPEARILMRLSGLWIPRLVARRKRLAEEKAAAEREANA